MAYVTPVWASARAPRQTTSIFLQRVAAQCQPSERKQAISYSILPPRGYVYGEPASPTLGSAVSFGTPTSEATAEIRNLWMVGYDAAVSLGLPRNWQPPDG